LNSVLTSRSHFDSQKKTDMSVRRRGEAKQANGSANETITHENVVDLKTDHTRWRMKNVDGRQTWHYLESDEELKAWPMTSADKYYLGMDTVG
jgi:lanosterol synthase